MKDAKRHVHAGSYTYNFVKGKGKLQAHMLYTEVCHHWQRIGQHHFLAYPTGTRERSSKTEYIYLLRRLSYCISYDLTAEQNGRLNLLLQWE